MRVKLFLSVCIASFIAVGFVFVDKEPDYGAFKQPSSAIEEWTSLEEGDLLTSLQSEKGAFLSHINFDRSQIEAALAEEDMPIVEFVLGIDEAGSLTFFVNSQFNGSDKTYNSGTTELKSKMQQFDKESYYKRNEQLPKKSREHIIDLDAAIEMIERWEKSGDSEKIGALVTDNGERLLSLSYNREVFESLLKVKAVSSVSVFTALNEDNDLTLVSIGRDINGNVLIPDRTNPKTKDYLMLDFSKPCPPTCFPPPPPPCNSTNCSGTCIDGACIGGD